MNDLFLILKYGFKNKARPKKKGLMSNNSVFGNIFGYLFPAILFMFIMLPFMLSVFNNTMIEIMPGVTFAELMASMYIALMSLLFFLQYSPAIINTLFNNDNIEFLLTTPVKKGTIFLSSAIDSFLVSGLPIGMMLSVIISYGIAADVNIFNLIISSIGYIFLMISLSLIAGLIFSYFIGKTAAKRFSQLMYFASIFAFVFMTNFIPTDQINQAQQGQLSGIFGNMTFLTGEFFPHTLLLKSMHGNIYFGLLSILISVLIIVLIYGVSTKLDFVTSRKKSKNKEQKIKLTGGMPVLKKDLRLLQRDSQSLFLILYPFLFPLIFIFINVQSMAAMNIMFIFIGSMYAAILSVGMMVNDMKIWPIPKTYPIKTEQIINNKISIPLIIFLTEYVIITIISAVLGYTNIIDYFMVIPVGLLLYYAALYGVKTYLKNPQRDTSNKNNVLTFKETIVFEGIIMGFGAAIFGLLTVYKINMQTPILDWSTILINLVFIGIPILCMGLLIFLIKQQKEQIKKYSNEI
ncbi:hypothetical protein [Geotoga petraea]|uniref:ABC-2 type transport system permease protein n=1 Tax=Geotoga petraea TaxID=28234 RepID=A0A1G6L8J9_9BACT|nr:hypothetical protein [Geotoga petraea]SDC38856.1 ABC-2 type transport system permease protein [Geotoga petraea]